MIEIPVENSEQLTGERMIPGHSPGSTELQHWRRYRYFAHLARATVLDVASGEGYGISWLAKYADRAIGIDLDRDAVRRAQKKYSRPRLTFTRGNAVCLPIKNGSVYRFFSFETLEHLPDAGEFLKEVKRVLSPDGIFVVSTPNRLVFSPGLEKPVNPFHQKEWEKEEFRDFIKSCFRFSQFFGQESSLGWKIHPDLFDTDLIFLSVASDAPLPPKAGAPKFPVWLRRLFWDSVDFYRVSIHWGKRKISGS